jgi:alginate O-acetyltransferase complex protein AlgI
MRAQLSGPTFQFVGFGLLAVLVAGVSRSTSWRQWVLLLASVVFLGVFAATPFALAPFAGFVAIGLLGRSAARKNRQAVVPAVLVVLVLFFWLKHYAFVPASTWITAPYVTIGLSYILFRLLHLIIEAPDEEAVNTITLRELLCYLIGFNTLVAGPIQRLDEYQSEWRTAASRSLGWFRLGRAAERIIGGLFKTNVLAALLAFERGRALETLLSAGASGHSLVRAVEVFALYPLFLYCNFSGYIDIAIGLSLLFGIRVPENFDRPFSATSFIEFWNRWHITLSRWLRTYVYNPLLLVSMRRFPEPRLASTWAVLAFFVTFFLVGVWHGQTVGFLFFGFLQGGGVSVNKLYQIKMTQHLGRQRFARLANSFWYQTAARGATFTWFAFTLIWFWASWEDAGTLWTRLSLAHWLAIWGTVFVLASILLAAWEVIRRPISIAAAPSFPANREVRVAWGTALLLVTAAVAMLSNQSAPEIVYKNF